MDSPLYRKAFEQYLRKGTPIEIAMKGLAETQLEHTTALYRWYTVGDDKVRDSHAANAGKIFAWDAPPPTGHPGEDHNCRCWAEKVSEMPTVSQLGFLLAGIGLIRLGGPGAIAGAHIIREIGSNVIRRVDWQLPRQPSQKPAELPRPEGIPKGWEKVPSNKGEGVKYVDPKNSWNEVRVQRGDPQSSNPGQRQDYVTWKRNGHYLDKNGNPVPRKSEESHIPIDKFKFDPGLFK